MIQINIKKFQQKIWAYYKNHKRDFLWRRTKNPYHILVSEIMLQQTQTEQVKKYYPKFIKQFPDFETLAHAPLREILKTWQGLGYNRRALYLKKLAMTVMEKYRGELPKNSALLEKLPGIGKATAGSISVFAFNIPAIFIETNIRRVFIHFFFPRKKNVSDNEILPSVEQTLDKNHSREWFYALMDYGTMLGKIMKENPNKKSARYHAQSKFKGSNRELRGKIVKFITVYSPIYTTTLIKKLSEPPHRVTKILRALEREGFIKYIAKYITCAS